MNTIRKRVKKKKTMDHGCFLTVFSLLFLQLGPRENRKRKKEKSPNVI